MYRVAGSVVIASGRPVPGAGAVNQRGEGIALVLSGPAAEGGMEFWGVPMEGVEL